LLLSPQFANLQILGLNPQSQIRKFLMYASQHISNPKISFDYSANIKGEPATPQIANPQI
jgi:hypothetical protein